MLLKVSMGIVKVLEYFFQGLEWKPGKAPNNTPPENNGDKPGVPGSNPPVNAILPNNPKKPEEDPDKDPKKDKDGNDPNKKGLGDKINDFKDKIGVPEKVKAWNEAIEKNRNATHPLADKVTEMESKWSPQLQAKIKENKDNIASKAAERKGERQAAREQRKADNQAAKEFGFRNANQLNRALNKAEKNGASVQLKAGNKATEFLGDWNKDQKDKASKLTYNYENKTWVKENFNPKAPDQAKMMEKLQNSVKDGIVTDIKEFRSFLKDFSQTVCKKEDINDKTQRVVTNVIDNVKNGNFSKTLIPEDKTIRNDLKSALMNTKGLSKEDRDAALNGVVKDIINSKDKMSDAEKNQLTNYTNGLKYMIDNKDSAAVNIGIQSCAIISEYLYGAMTNKITDISKESYEKFYTDKFERGEIGLAEGAPVRNTSLGQYNSSRLNFETKIEDQNALVRTKAELKENGKTNTDYIINNSKAVNIIDNKQIDERKAELNNMINENKNIINELKNQQSGIEKEMETYNKNLEIEHYERSIKQYDSLLEEQDRRMSVQLSPLQNSNQNAYIVQKKDSYDDTHYFIVAKDSQGTYRTFDFNHASTTGEVYDYDNTNIVSWFWDK